MSHSYCCTLRCFIVSSKQHYEHKLKEMDVEVHRHEQEHERLLADLEKLEKQTEVAVQVRREETKEGENRPRVCM